MKFNRQFKYTDGDDKEGDGQVTVNRGESVWVHAQDADGQETLMILPKQKLREFLATLQEAETHLG